MLIDLIGKRYGRLTVLSVNGKRGHYYYWNCLCDCGKETVVCSTDLKSGCTKSCGCLHDEMSRERARKQFTTHGLSKTRLHSIWLSMRTRCNNPNSKSYKDYGAKGVSVCSEWQTDFLSFYQWSMANGYAEDLTIDRIDYNGNYCPENCRWVTIAEQARNTRSNRWVTINGETRILSDWAKIIGINRKTLSDRIDKGLPDSELVKPPCR